METKIRTFKLNLQTTLFLSNEVDTVLAAYNANSNVLVYNKSHISGFELEIVKSNLHMMKAKKYKTVQADSFEVHFWTIDGNKNFHEV